MKQITLLLFFGSASFFAVAQINTKEVEFKNQINIDLETQISIKHLQGKISSVNLIDARDDSSEIGYYSSINRLLKPGLNLTGDGFLNKQWSKVYNFKSSAKEVIGKWMTNYLQVENSGSTNLSLLVVIRKFWLSSEASLVLYDNDKRGQPNEGWDEGIISKFEFYLEKDSVYYPLYRADSIFTFKEELPESAALYITTAIKKSLDKLFTIDLDNSILNKRKLHLNDILLNYQKNTDVPVLKSTAYKKGVYKNFEEFKMNSPSVSEYELRKGEMGDIIYIKENNVEYPERNVWGFCDGTSLFINSGNKKSTCELC